MLLLLVNHCYHTIKNDCWDKKILCSCKKFQDYKGGFKLSILSNKDKNFQLLTLPMNSVSKQLIYAVDKCIINCKYNEAQRQIM